MLERILVRIIATDMIRFKSVKLQKSMFAPVVRRAITHHHTMNLGVSVTVMTVNK